MSESQSHLPVLVESLKPSDSLPFPLYVLLGDSLMLFRTQRDRLAAHDLEELLRAEKVELVTSGERSDAYLPLISDSVKSVVGMPGMPRERLGECYRRGLVAASHILANAETEAGYQCAENLTETMIELLDQCAHEYAATADLMKTDPNFAEHALQTSMLGMMLANAVGYPHVAQLGIGLLLHDLGEVALPREVRECRTQGERTRYESHPRLGAQLLAKAPWCSPKVVDIVLNHHERLDGSGFPGGCKGSDLSPAARIAAIVEAYDEGVSGSPRAESRKNFAVLQELLVRDAGKFDPDYLKAFVRLQAARAEA